MSNCNFGFKPAFPNDVSKQVIDFIYKHLTVKDPSTNIEIEAKFGRLVDLSTGNRIFLPIATEAVLNDTGSSKRWYRFESCIAVDHYQKLNQAYNDRIRAAHSVTYKHTKTFDSFFNIQSYGKCRVSREQSSGNVIEIIQKNRIADMHIFFPNSWYDVRISVNSERSLPIELFSSNSNCLADQGTRYKDRMAYVSDSFIEVDLTQVRSENSPSATYELEMEIKDFSILLAERQKLANKEENSFVHLCNSFLNNIRVIPGLIQ